MDTVLQMVQLHVVQIRWTVPRVPKAPKISAGPQTLNLKLYLYRNDH